MVIMFYLLLHSGEVTLDKTYAVHHMMEELVTNHAMNVSDNYSMWDLMARSASDLIDTTVLASSMTHEFFYAGMHL